MKKETWYKYAVIFSMRSTAGTGEGRMFMTITYKKMTEEVILEMEKYIMKVNPDFDNVFIKNLIKLETVYKEKESE